MLRLSTAETWRMCALAEALLSEEEAGVHEELEADVRGLREARVQDLDVGR